MSKSIVLSPKHGVNPSIDCCLICGKEIGVAMFGRLKGDIESPKKCCSGNLCDDCKEQIKTNVAILEVNNKNDSTRTGKYAFIPKEYINIPNKGILYITKENFNKLFNNN